MLLRNAEWFTINRFWSYSSFWRYNDVSVFQQFTSSIKIDISIWKQTVLCDSQMSYLTENILRVNN